jgi:hypothetical protein
MEFSTATADKSDVITLSGTPKLTATGLAANAFRVFVRANRAITPSKFQFEVTLTDLVGQRAMIGVDDGTQVYGPSDLSNSLPGYTNALAALLSVNAGDCHITVNANGAGTQLSIPPVAVDGDVISVRGDKTAKTVSFYRNGTQIGTTVTIAATWSEWNIMVGTFDAEVLTLNPGTSAFTKALDGGYEAANA